MQVESSYSRISVASVLTIIPDPIQATPPLALNAFHLLHPDGYPLRFVRVGPITCTQPAEQQIVMAVWGWDGTNWRLLHDGINLVAQLVGTVNRADAVQLDIPINAPGPYSAVCVIPRASYVASGDYLIYIAAGDCRRWPC